MICRWWILRICSPLFVSLFWFGCALVARNIVWRGGCIVLIMRSGTKHLSSAKNQTDVTLDRVEFFADSGGITIESDNVSDFYDNSTDHNWHMFLSPAESTRLFADLVRVVSESNDERLLSAFDGNLSRMLKLASKLSERRDRMEQGK